MNIRKLFALIGLCSLQTIFLFAQSNKVYVTATTSPYADTVTKPAIIINKNPDKNKTTESRVNVEEKTVTPESKLSIGKASIVPSADKAKSNSGNRKETEKPVEQTREVEKSPSNNSSVQPK